MRRGLSLDVMRWFFGVLVCVVLLGVLPVRAQPALWASHLSVRKVEQLAAAPGAVWAATEGGVFRYAPADGTFERYSLIDGLSGVRAAAVAYDASREHVWIGYADGLLDRLDPATGHVTTFRDIERATQFSDRSVTRLRLAGDSVLVAASFGVVVFDASKGEVRDTYSRFGTFTSGIAVRDVALAPGPGGGRALWVSTEEGVAVGPLDGRNLQDPGAWLDGQTGLPTADTRGLALFGGTLYVGTAQGLYARSPGSGWTFVASGDFSNLATDGTVLVAHERFSLMTLRLDGALERVQPNPDGPFDFILPRDVAVVEGRIVVADERASLAVLKVDGIAFEQYVTPTGPAYNTVISMDFAPDGTLWTSSSGAGGEGFQKRSPDGEWTGFDRDRNSDLLGTAGSFGAVEVADDGAVWLGTDGSGLLGISPEDDFTLYGRLNSTLRTAAPVNPDFILVEGLATAPDGTLWATNRFSERPLHVRLPDGTWTGFRPFTQGALQPSYTGYQQILLDGFGTKWITLLDENNQRLGRGLIVYDSGRDPVDTADDAVRYFGERGAAGSGLPAILVTSLAEDRDGRIWIGTERGIAYLLNNGIAARDPASTFVWPVDPTGPSFLLNNIIVNALAVDPANGLWVGTNEGVWLVREREGGFEIAEHFTMANAPLPADKVLALAVEPRTGEVYIATEQGMISYRGGVQAPVAEVQDLFVYPNPARISGDDRVGITIRGLVEQTALRILTPAGGVVRHLDTRGGSVVWDGRDGDGRLVPSGMYLVVAVGQDGEGAAYGKVAVIR